MRYAQMMQDSVSYHVPAGYTVESSPSSSDVSWPNNAILSIKSTPISDGVNVARLLARNFLLVKSSDYQQLHDFYVKVATADQQQIVLTRAAAPASKGN
jgi:penicillin V acylase-like amidase (Ntn superfamily)